MDDEKVTRPHPVRPAVRAPLRTSPEVAYELSLLATVLHLEARKPGPARGLLARASQVLAEAPLHAVEQGPLPAPESATRALLPLVQEAAAVLALAVEASTRPAGTATASVAQLLTLERVITRLLAVTREIELA